MNIQNSVVLVTGGNRGIGEAFVRAFLAAGAGRVYVGARDVNNAVHLVNEAHRRPALIRWSATGLLTGALLFGGGVWLGTLLK